MNESSVSNAKRRVLDRLKRTGPATAAELAESLGLTDVAVRQHLLALERDELVVQETRPPRGRGRPSVQWSLTPLSAGLFPDRHGELTVGLIDAIRSAVGEEGLLRVIDVRGDRQVRAYRKLMPPAGASLRKRVEALARLRTGEGYMAEVSRERDGAYLLIEHHCPICTAARSCTGLCTSELSVFRRTLGGDASVERVQHLISGDLRCVYRINLVRQPARRQQHAIEPNDR